MRSHHVAALSAKRESMVCRDSSITVILSGVSRMRNAVEESLIISALIQRRRIRDPSTPLRVAQDDNLQKYEINSLPAGLFVTDNRHIRR
jgi:hypothetical protein